jgi:NAD(P)-dependent dehydrogenase (short-subunit alcohol dehydrogenase family)
MFDLTGKVAVVTGGSGILGRTMCAGLAKQGATVMILDRNPESGEALKAEILASGYQADFFETDVLNLDVLKGVREKILSKYGHIDILINGAGGNMPKASIQPDQRFFDLDVNAVRAVIDLNYFGTLYSTMVFAEPMCEQGKGSIINISSASAERPLTVVMGYGSAKAAVKNLTQWLAVEFATKYGEGVRVNALTPGFLLTDQNRFLVATPEGELSPRGKLIVSNTPMRRMGDPKELLAAIIYLASDEASFVTGTTAIVDGGFDAFYGV